MPQDQVRVHVVQEKDRSFLSMRYRDPLTGKRVKRSAGTSHRKEAERRAHAWEAAINEGRDTRPSRIEWAAFRERYEVEKLSSLSPGTREASASALNHFERVIGVAKLVSVISEVMSRFQAELRREGMKDTTLNGHLGHLQAALSWAVSMGMLPKMPAMHRPKRVKGRKLMRGRPVSGEEAERMLAAVPKVRPNDSAAWVHFVGGLWLSGLRLEEGLALSWEPDALFAVDLSGRHPRFRITGEAQKNGQDQFLPMSPDFARYLLEIPEEARAGRVFKVNSTLTGRPMTGKRVSRIITKIGKAAGVVVDRTKKRVKRQTEGKTEMVEVEVLKYASAHDLRRGFGTKWARRCWPATLQKLMRHASINTTMAYYVDLDADAVADELWRAETAQEGPSLGPTGRNQAKKQERAAVDVSTEAL